MFCGLFFFFCRFGVVFFFFYTCFLGGGAPHDGEDAQITAQVENALQKWAGTTSGFYKKLSGGLYLVIMEERNMRAMVEKKIRYIG